MGHIIDDNEVSLEIRKESIVITNPEYSNKQFIYNALPECDGWVEIDKSYLFKIAEYLLKNRETI